jgi:hypothetical protein
MSDVTDILCAVSKGDLAGGASLVDISVNVSVDVSVGVSVDVSVGVSVDVLVDVSVASTSPLVCSASSLV